jgi:hypothetical protein
VGVADVRDTLRLRKVTGRRAVALVLEIALLPLMLWSGSVPCGSRGHPGFHRAVSAAASPLESAPSHSPCHGNDTVPKGERNSLPNDDCPLGDQHPVTCDGISSCHSVVAYPLLGAENSPRSIRFAAVVTAWQRLAGTSIEPAVPPPRA